MTLFESRIFLSTDSYVETAFTQEAHVVFYCNTTDIIDTKNTHDVEGPCVPIGNGSLRGGGCSFDESQHSDAERKWLQDSSLLDSSNDKGRVSHEHERRSFRSYVSAADIRRPRV